MSDQSEEASSSSAYSSSEEGSTSSEVENNVVQKANYHHIVRERRDKLLKQIKKQEKDKRWYEREKVFENFRAGILVMPVPDGTSRIEKAKGYCLNIMSILNWPLPDSIGAKLPIEMNDQRMEEQVETFLTLGIHVSLFHANSKRFFGNTWVSPEICVDKFNIKEERIQKTNTIRKMIEAVTLNYRAYFASDVMDPSCVGVVELVAYEKDPDSLATINMAGCGWTILPLFTQNNQSASITAGTQSGESVNVFMGSPRILWEIPQSAWQTQEKLEYCKFVYQLTDFAPIIGLHMFLRKNEIVGALEPIAGLKGCNMANLDDTTHSKLQPNDDESYEDSLMTYVKLASMIPRSIQLEEDFVLNVVASRVAIHLREEIEENLISRLKLSRKSMFPTCASIDGEISARVLRVGLHNGRCFRTRMHTIPLKVDQRGNDHLVCVPNKTKLKGFVLSPYFAIVLVLQYTVHFRLNWTEKQKKTALEKNPKEPLPEQDVVLVTMGTRAVIPSDGKKLYLYDKNSFAIARDEVSILDSQGQQQQHQTKILHVDLLSGSACRPYSDTVIFTPPYKQGIIGNTTTTSKKQRGRVEEDSFSSVDLHLEAEGSTTLPSSGSETEKKPVKKPSSPFKKTETKKKKSKKTSDTDSEEQDQNKLSEGAKAAELWAQRMLQKAGDSSVVAQMLNALAKSKDDPKKKPIIGAGSGLHASSSFNQAVKTHLVRTPDVADMLSTDLSRMSKTLLSRHGFMDPEDDLKATSNQKQSPTKQKSKAIIAGGGGGHIPKSIGPELEDIYQAHEIRFHFAAYRALSINTSTVPSHVYFTFQFYTFAPSRTERMRLSPSVPNTFLLMRQNADIVATSKPSHAIQFEVDTTKFHANESRVFAEYLLTKNLYVDVWNADSLLQIGTIVVPLHELLRQGAGVKKCHKEFDILSSQADTRTSEGGLNSTIVGKIQLLMSNFGVKGCNDMKKFENSFQVGSRSNSNNTTINHSAMVSRTKHRVRARPLVDSNEELYHLLEKEGFYGRRSTKSSKDGDDDGGGSSYNQRRRLQAQRRGMSDYSSLSQQEIDILCELFSSEKGNRIQCGTKNQGLLALLSIQAGLNKQQVHYRNNKSILVTGDRLKRILAMARANVSDLTKSFACFDKNGDGVLTIKEFVDALRGLGKIFEDISTQDLIALASVIDTDGDGTINVKEFLSFLERDDLKLSEEDKLLDQLKRVIMRAMDKGIELLHLFSEFDKSGDGHISFKELLQVLKKLGFVLTNEKDKKLFEQKVLQKLDQDGDEHVSYEEFLHFCGFDKTSAKEHQLKDMEDTLKKVLNKAVEQKGLNVFDLFEHFDQDKSGKLNLEEFEQALTQLNLPDFHSNHDILKAFIQKHSKDGDDTIDYREFLMFCGVNGDGHHLSSGSSSVALRLDNKLKKLFQTAFVRGISIEELFQQFDTDKSGTITIDELSQMLKGLFQQEMSCLTQEELTEFVHLLNNHKNDKNTTIITWTSFNAYVNKCIGRMDTLKKQLQQVVVKAHEQHGLTAEECFKQFDTDGDAQINAKELLQVFKTLGFVSNKEDKDIYQTIEEMVQSLDTNGDGKMDYHEFLKFLNLDSKQTSNNTTSAKIKLQQLFKTAIQQGVNVTECFKHFDVDDNGQINVDEFRQGLVKLGFTTLSTNEIAELLSALDPDKSGTILLSEFEQFCGVTSSNSTSQVDIVVDNLRQLVQSAVKQGIDVLNAFEHFDKQKKGFVSIQEFDLALTELNIGFDTFSKEEKKKLIQHLDTDESGQISLKEFQEFIGVNNTQKPSADILLRAFLQEAQAQGLSVNDLFTHFDKDKKGQVDTSAFLEGLKELRPEFEAFTQKDKDILVTQLDQDKTGTITLDNFQKFLNRSTDNKPIVNSSSLPSVDMFKTFLQSAVQQQGMSVQEIFKHFDAEEKGQVTMDRFKQGISQLGLDELTDKDMDTICSVLDTKKTGYVTLEAFQLFITSTNTTTVTAPAPSTNTPTTNNSLTTRLHQLLFDAKAKGIDVVQSFEHFDTDGDGEITIEEFTKGLQPLDFENVSSEEVEQFVKQLDKNQNGTISLKEFQLFLENPPPPLPSKPKPKPPTKKPATAKKPTTDKPAPTTSEPEPSNNGTTSTKAPVRRSSIPNAVERCNSLANAKKNAIAEKRRASIDKSKEEIATELTTKTEKPSTNKSETVADTVAKTKPTTKTAASTVDTNPTVIKQDQQQQEEEKQEEEAAFANVPFNFECAYSFHKDPSIRSVEVKLRKAALDAFEQRGIVPSQLLTRYVSSSTKKKKKQQQQQQQQASTTELMRVEFIQFLMDLGFSVIQDQDDHETGYPIDSPLMNDKLYARQLERLRKYRQSLRASMSKDEAKAQRQLIRAASKSVTTRHQEEEEKYTAAAGLKKYVAQKDQMLRVLQYYRDGHKKALVHSLLREHVTSTLHLFPSFGQMVFFEFPFKNPYNHTERFKIEWQNSHLNLVINAEEWKYYREEFCHDNKIKHGSNGTGGNSGSGGIESEMIDDLNELMMEGNDLVHLPFRFLSLDPRLLLTTTNNNKKQEPLMIHVLIKSVAHGHTVAMLKLVLHPVPFICHRIKRFYCASGSILRQHLRLETSSSSMALNTKSKGRRSSNQDDDDNNDEDALQLLPSTTIGGFAMSSYSRRERFIYCADPSVVVETKMETAIENSQLSPQDIFLKCRVGEYPASSDFYLLLYKDPFHACLDEIWHIRVQTMLRVDLHATMGQTLKNELVLKGDSVKRRVQCFSSSPNQVAFQPAHVFHLVPSSFNRIVLFFCSMEMGQKQIRTHLVDVDTHELVGAWLLNVSVAEPFVTKRYELTLPLNQIAQKKISYKNPWEEDQEFFIRSSDAELMKPREGNRLRISRGDQAYLRLTFSPVSQPMKKQLYLFINDSSSDQNEECLVFETTWT